MSDQPKTPKEIEPHQGKYREGAWRNYTLAELGNFVHLLAKRSQHRTDPVKRTKDIEDARNYLRMMKSHLNWLENQSWS